VGGRLLGYHERCIDRRPRANDDALTEAEADADRLAERVRSVRLMFETAGMHRTAEDMDDVLDQHDALVSKRAAT
jgi:hypothetical protein